MAVNQQNPTAYGLSQAVIDVPNKPIQANRAPTNRDKAPIGTLWINIVTDDVYIETSIVDNVANWEFLTSSGGTVTDLLADDGGFATPINGVIGILGDINITTNTNVQHAITVTLNPKIILPNTNADQSEGIIQLGANRFISNYGENNTFIGADTGNTTLNTNTAVANTALGSGSLNTITTSQGNTGIGVGSLTALTTGGAETGYNVGLGAFTLGNATTAGKNTALGTFALQNVVSGKYNIGIGYESGFNVAVGNSNILLANPGDGADNNVMRLGETGSGDGQVNTTYIAGIYNQTVGAVGSAVIIDSDGKLGSSPALDGQILIGDTGGKPAWANITSTGGSVTITNSANGINLEAAGVAALTGLDGDVGSASPVGGVIVIAGDGVTTQTSAAADTVTVELTNGTNGQLLIGGGANPIWANLTSSGGSVTITNGVNSINLEAAGVAAITQLTSDAGTANPVAGNIVIAGNDIIETSAVGNTLTVSTTPTTNGQIPIGRTSDGVAGWATLTAGSGINIVNGPRSITISASGAEATRPAFLYQQVGNQTFTTNVAGAPPVNTPYYLGANRALTLVFDQGSNVFPGDGAGTPASFTAPFNGIYWFKISTRHGNTNPDAGAATAVYTTTILPSAGNAFNKSIAYANISGGLPATISGYQDNEVILQLNLGDTVQFLLTYEANGGSSRTASYTVFGDGGTYIMGNLVSRI